MLKSCAAACENTCAILARRCLEYLIKERVVPPLDPGPVGLSTHMDLHHRFDVVSRQLTGLNDSNTNLRAKKTEQLSQNREQLHSGTQEPTEDLWTPLEVEEDLPRARAALKALSRILLQY